MVATRAGSPRSPAGRCLRCFCATLAADLDDKVAADIRRLVETTNTECIIYCSSRPLTEQSCDKIETIIRRLFPSVHAVRILGQIQLVALIERYEEPFRRNYAAELQNIETALLRPAMPEPKQIGLRLSFRMRVFLS